MENTSTQRSFNEIFASKKVARTVYINFTRQRISSIFISVHLEKHKTNKAFLAFCVCDACWTYSKLIEDDLKFVVDS